MKKLVLVPNNPKSKAAKLLANTLSEHLGYKVWRVSPWRVRNRKAFVFPKGTDKLTQLTLFNHNEIPCPEFTRDIATASSWTADGDTVICRRLLRGSEGRGIVVAETPEQVVPAPLYTKYVKKKAEYRVHVIDGEAIDVQQKKKKRDFDKDARDTKIRNTANGYVFCRDGINPPDGIRELAVRAVTCLGYRIGGVDIAYNEKRGSLIVLEVNANPGMEGTTLDNYASCISFAHVIGDM